MIDVLSQLTATGVLQGTLTLTSILILPLISLYLVNLAAKMIDKQLIAPIQDLDRRKWLQTMRKLGKSTLQDIIIAIAVLIGLSTIGIDIGPTLAATCILGLVVSLGAQTLSKDIIGGLAI
jgi:small-conductance mechanosensitive channel